MPRFDQLFGRAPQATARAPGRVNLLGEHTDYNLGLVLPLAIPRHVTVEIARSTDGWHRLHSVQLDSTVEWRAGRPAPDGFANYVYGCIEVLRGRGQPVPAVLARVDSDVPIGAGLSSSAALEVALLRALRSLLNLAIDDEQIARVAHEAENHFAGVRCGILDQMASSLAATDRMLYLDTRSLERRLLPLPADAALLIVDSGQPRSLAASGYNQRRAECERAAGLLGLASLRDMTTPDAAGRLPPPLDRRARHVFSENARVRRAADGVDAAAFGALMNDSHASLSADYQVSTPVLDELAVALQADTEVFGAKLTGAGFGGACVALVRPGRSAEVAARVMSGFGAVHREATVLLTT
jgi:galactokinase